jgi:cation-transporting ATPase E
VDASRESAESAATLTLVILGLWTLYELARPLDRVRTLLLVGLVAGAVGAFTVPFVADFFSLEVPPADVALTIAATVALAVPAITIGIRAVGPAIGTWAGREPSEG